MATLKLRYFDFHGGRGEPARLALALGNIAFEDERIPPSTWADVKATTPFHALPVLEVDGEVLTQSNAINRYVGRMAGLYPEDPFDAAHCDEVMDAVEDVVTRVVATFGLAPEPLREAREALVAGALPLYLRQLEARLTARGGEWFAGRRLSVADLKVFVWIQNLRSGILDHVPRDLVDRVAPQLVDHCARVAALPAVVAYYEGH